MKKRIISGILSAVMAINVITILPANAFAIGTESKIYEKDGYTVTYQIGSEWDGNRSVEVSIKNTGEESILNWALKYDVGGEVYNLWNSKVYDSSEEYTVIKNNGYNYEIEPGQSANYGYIVKGEETVIPEDIELCSRRIEVKSGYEINFTVADDWHTGFNGEISITNTSDEPIEAWTLSFDSNFDISNIWNAKLLTSEKRSYKAANQLWTTPIKAGESASFGFSAEKSATENANAENFVLTAVVVGRSTLEYPDFDDIDYELDSDSDGLPDYYEDILGTDKNNPDTDGDGLTDGYEMFYLGTDPLKADSDDNGVNDGDEDPDNDGLSNLKECELGTDPNNSDTDGDGLTDGAEVNIHKTDPLKYDTDEDGISDGDEIALGLDPNSGSTNGTPDSERTFKQVVTSDSEVLSAINEDEETPFKVSLEMKAAGVAKNNVYARESGYSNAIENSAILGAAPEFVYTDGLAVEEVTVKFELNDSAVNNTLGTYAAENDGYKGIKRLNVFMFFEDINMLLPIETQYDESNNIVSATTDRVGTYCLMDMEMFFQNLGIELSKSADVEGSGAMSENSIDNDNYECYTVSEIEACSSNPEDEGYIGPVSTYKDNFDVYFVVDRANYTDEVLRSYCQKILETSEKIWAVSPNVNILLYAVNGNGYSHFDNYGRFKNAGALKTELDKISQNKNVLTTTLADGTTMREVYLSKAVDSIINSYDGKRKIYGFVFFDSANNIFQTKGDSKALLYGVKYGDRKINISVCSNIPEKYKSVENYGEMSYAVALYKMTNGIDISAGDFTNQALEHIYGEVPEFEEGTAYDILIATDYRTINLEKPITEKYIENGMKYGHNYIKKDDFDEEDLIDCADTDGDGLWDFQEIKIFKGITESTENQIIKFEDGELILPTINYMTKEVYKDFYTSEEITEFRECFAEQYGRDVDSEFWNTSVLPICSDPTQPDADNDGLLDGEAQYVNGKIVVPKDYDRLYYNGPQNAKYYWEKQVYMQQNNKYQTQYAEDRELDKDFEEFFKKLNLENHKFTLWTLLYEIDELKGNHKFISNVIIKNFAYAPITTLIKNTSFGTEYGASFLRFRRSLDGKTYHARPNRDYNQWQFHLGYLDLYDDVFKQGTDALRKKICFEYKDEIYILWCWKADYMNLGIGSEFGVYKIAQNDEYELFNGKKFEEFTVVDHNRKMTNSTYYYNTNIANWQPEEPIWWATAFNPAYKNKCILDIQNTYVLGSIDFSTSENDKSMYKCFKHDVNEGNDNGGINKYNQEFHAKDSLIFDDDNYIVWLLWRGNEQNE